MKTKLQLVHSGPGAKIELLRTHAVRLTVQFEEREQAVQCYKDIMRHLAAGRMHMDLEVGPIEEKIEFPPCNLWESFPPVLRWFLLALMVGYCLGGPIALAVMWLMGDK